MRSFIAVVASDGFSWRDSARDHLASMARDHDFFVSGMTQAETAERSELVRVSPHRLRPSSSSRPSAAAA
jgi:hypothetical protein